MGQAILISHLPLLRMKRDKDVAFADGVLTKLPWEQFDGLSQGAFSDWHPKYRRTEPVCFWYEKDLDLPFVKPGTSPDGMAEVKVPIAAWNILGRLGFGHVAAFHDVFVDPIWAALALAAPAGILPPPRSSFTFFIPAGEGYFEIGGRTTNGVRVQGDADLEFPHLPDGAGQPLDDEVLAAAASLVGLARFALEHAVIGTALRQLLTCGDVTLAPFERMLLAVTAIEHLLLPETSTGTGEVFAGRLAALLTADESTRGAIHEMARYVYRRRTAVLHADSPANEEVDLPPAAAEQLLASTVIAVTTAIASGTSIEQLRTELDGGQSARAGLKGLPLSDPPGRSGRYRLGPRDAWETATSSSGESLESAEGSIVSWSPLVGLAHDANPLEHEELGITLTSVSADAVVGMEDKDIRRDFVAQTRLAGPVAVLAAVTAHESLIVDEEHVAPLTRRRDLAVVGLRLAGLERFVDPELLGWYVYARSIRYRRETVLRQSIITHIGHADPAHLSIERHEEIRGLWTLLAQYEQQARDGEVDRILDLYRRIHHRRFLPARTRAILAASAIETMLGRFRPATATLRLERLVKALDQIDETAAAWFETSGRAFRNALAHGEWVPEPVDPSETWTKDDEPVAHLLAIARAGVRTLLGVWVNAPPPVRARHGPARLLVRSLGRTA